MTVGKVHTIAPKAPHGVPYYKSQSNSTKMRHYNKAQVLQQFRYNWKVATLENPSLKTDKIAKRIAFGDFTDMLCKCNEISLKQYETWTNPF